MMNGMILWGLLWMLIGIAVLVLAVMSIVDFVRRDRDTGGGSRQSVESILRKRFAVGEIDEGEYNHRRSQLSRSPWGAKRRGKPGR